tara:strand:+ start:609 stop:803 length:195 start_codon:yes stop_codon:yes gene_type:complete
MPCGDYRTASASALATAGDSALEDHIGWDVEVSAGGGRIMGSLANSGGLAGLGGLAGHGGGLAG